MKKIISCYYCKKDDNEDGENAIFQLPNKKYIHHKCFLFLEREKKELDDLVEIIKKVHNISVIPSRFYPFLQDLRNGTNRCQRSNIKKSKKGYRYVFIKKTYEFYQDEIRKHIKYKKIEDVNNMLMYSYAIVVSKIAKVKDSLLKKHLEEKGIKKQVKYEGEEIIIASPQKDKAKKYDWLD